MLAVLSAVTFAGLAVMNPLSMTIGKHGEVGTVGMTLGWRCINNGMCV